MITLGTSLSDRKPVTIDVPKLVESRLLIQANSGAGKSFTIRRIMEQTYGEVQHIILDVEDEFYTLREKFDYVICGQGDKVDCKADLRSAPHLAKKLLELNVSAIIGLYELKAHDRIRFVRLFLESLIDAPRKLWHPCLVVVDEAHMMCPQNGQAESAAAVIDLMTRGRKRGLCGVLATQRISKLHKDAAAEANNKLIGRSALDNDMKRAAEELGFTGRDEQHELRMLKPGQFYAFGPALSDIVEKIQIGSVQTTHPKVGQRVLPTPPPRSKVKAVLAELEQIPHEAEQERVTIDSLQIKIRDLTRQITQQVPVKAEPTTEEIMVIEKRGYDSALTTVREWDEEIIAALDRLKTKLITRRDFKPPLYTPWPKNGRPKPDISGIEVLQRRNHRGETDDQETRNSAQPPFKTTPTASTYDDNRSTGGIRRIMIALAQRPDGLTKKQIGVRAGLSSKSGTFSTYISKLRTLGWITNEIGGIIMITDTGVASLGKWDPLPTGHALYEYWMRELGESGASRIFHHIYMQNGNACDRATIGRETGMSSSSGTFATYISKLRSLELIDKYGDQFQLSAEFLK